ncbi:MAG: DUF1553 domain-containing protein [Planctomycetaceae bacterium]|nr:DUF1553 domain-containing protein [Planctomycetaceae bacterium]
MKMLRSLCVPAVFLTCAVTANAAEQPEKRLVIGPDISGQGIQLRSADARQQLLVTFESGPTATDVTRVVQYSVVPEGVLTVDASGLVTPLADGMATLTATLPGQNVSATIPISAAGFASPPPINFRNQVVPIFTKLGCNGGGCHGKSGGQNGFRLSLLGFYPEDDYEFLRKESRGRRIFPAEPARSLLLTKATGLVPHGGGKRMAAGDYEYRMLARWIEQGMPYGSESDPAVTGITCYPPTRVMPQSSEQQITVIATYSDGSTEDVTRMCLFEPNDSEMAECSETGLVNTLDLAGEVAIMARYQGQVSTFRATVPLGADTSELPEAVNVVDTAVFNKLRLLGIPASAPSTDAAFLRRVSLDIAGTIPTASQVQEFLADTRADKRDRLIDRLLDSQEYADNFAKKWNFILRNKKTRNEDRAGTQLFHQWIWDSLYENKPYDQFVREIITASGEPLLNPAVTWYREVDQVEEQVEDTAQLFLGIRIQCARCHHHPFEKWSQNDYYSLAAFYRRVGRKNINGVAGQYRDRSVFHNEGVATASNPRTGASLKPAGLGAPPLDIPADRDPRVQLADWMSEPANPFFAKSLVNRYWKHFFNRGIVEPEDDMRETNPPSNPELLDALADRFIRSGFDLKDLVRTICRSRTYQLSSLPNEYNASDKQNFSRYYPRRLSAEALYDAFHTVTDTSERFGGMPAGTRALQLADSSGGPYFLKVFGMPEGDTACECERSADANLAQSLHLLNSKEVQDKISKDGARAAQLAAEKDRTHAERMTEIYQTVFSRNPTADELKVAIAYIERHKDNPRVAYEDLLWALVNTKEFLFNH